MTHYTYTYQVYALIDPDTNQVHYVGGTIDGIKNRLSGHLSSKTNTRVSLWVKSIKDKGLKPEIIELESLSYRKHVPCREMNEMEHFWINYFNFLGSDLKNRQLLKGRNNTRSDAKIKNHLTKLEE